MATVQLTVEAVPFVLWVEVQPTREYKAAQRALGLQVLETKYTLTIAPDSPLWLRVLAAQAEGLLFLSGASWLVSRGAEFPASARPSVGLELAGDTLSQEALTEMALVKLVEECRALLKAQAEGETQRRQDLAEREAAYAARRAQQQELEAAKAQREAAGKATLQAWAQEHGSELLQLRIAEAFAWEGLARQEWADRCLDQPVRALDPSGFKFARAAEGGDAKPREAPSLAEIQALIAARGALAGVPGLEVALYAVAYHADDDGYEEDVSIVSRSVELRVDATTPDGKGVVRFYSVA